MDRTNVIAMVVALTAGSIVTFEYLRWSNSRHETRAVPVATSTAAESPQVEKDSGKESQIENQTGKHKESSQESQIDVSANQSVVKTTAEPPEAACNCEQCQESSQESHTDFSANRPSLLSRNKEDRLLFGVYLLKTKFHVHCSCDKHTKEIYFNWPYSCDVKHQEDDIVVQAGSRPTLIYEFKTSHYEGLSLANRTIDYFSRSSDTMDPKQLSALNQWRQNTERTHVLDMLAKADIRSKETDHLTCWLVERLNEIFFFGAIKNLETVWNTKELDKIKGLLADASVSLKDGQDYAVIRLQPTRRCHPKAEYIRKGQTLAEERMGCILHEMLHVFVTQFVCARCAPWEN